MFASDALAEADALRRLSGDELLLPLLAQLTLIIVAARAFGLLFRRLGQPTVVGEVVAGLVLGPTVFGRLAPDLFAALFHPALGEVPQPLANAFLPKVLSALSQIGLVLLLFLIGLEFDFGHLRWHGRSALAISLAGIAVPFAFGLGLGPFVWPQLEALPETGRAVPELGFTLYLGVALSITAIPVLGRILMELNLTRSRLGSLTMAAAAVDDAIGWVLLAAVTSSVRTGFEPLATAGMIGRTVAFALGMVCVAGPLLRRWGRWVLPPGRPTLSLNALTVLLTLVFGCAIATNWIGISAVFGALLLGGVLSGQHELREAIEGRLRDLVMVFFVPIFFAYTGLRTNLGALMTAEMGLILGLVVLAGVAGKFVGCGLVAWLSGYRKREAAAIGALMNTRGLMALVIVNIGAEMRVIPPSMYSVLVLMALLTTALTTPLVLWLAPGTELEPYLRDSEFRRRARATVTHRLDSPSARLLP